MEGAHRRVIEASGESVLWGLRGALFLLERVWKEKIVVLHTSREHNRVISREAPRDMADGGEIETHYWFGGLIRSWRCFEGQQMSSEWAF